MAIKTCPNCGGELTPLILEPDTPPWGCYNGCERAWWEAELAARDLWSTQLRRFTSPISYEAEMQEAVQRGCSLRPDQVQFLGDREIQALSSLNVLPPSVQTEVVKQAKGRGFRG